MSATNVSILYVPSSEQTLSKGSNNSFELGKAVGGGGGSGYNDSESVINTVVRLTASDLIDGAMMELHEQICNIWKKGEYLNPTIKYKAAIA